MADSLLAELAAVEAQVSPPMPSSVGGVPLDFSLLDVGHGFGDVFELVSPTDQVKQQAVRSGGNALPCGLPPLPWTDDALRGMLFDQFLKAPPADDSCHDFRHAQRFWTRDADLSSLFTMDVTPPAQTIEPVDEDYLSGLGWREAAIIGAGASAKDSISLLRGAGDPRDFVRGGSSHIPFLPGGLEDRIESRLAAEMANRDKDDDGHLLETPPGFLHGLMFDISGGVIPEELARDAAEQLQAKNTVISLADVVGAEWDDDGDTPIAAPTNDISNPQRTEQISVKQEETLTTVEQTTTGELDGLDEILNFSAKSKATQLAKGSGSEWAVMMDISLGVPNFHELVPNPAFSYPFELDPFQKQAVLLLEQHHSVFVAAHTSAGKTVVAEYAIALAQKHLTRTIYTSPIKALSNQKFRDFKQTFGDVGLLTGDVQIKPDAACLIMTTEILRSMLYHGADLIRDVEWVIFDEVHYINDAERGVVWEEVIIMLPPHVGVVLLSATVPNTQEFASWVGRTKKQKIHVISTLKRPVPLEHFLYTGNSTKTADNMFKIVDSTKTFLAAGYKQALLSIQDRKKKATAAFGPKGPAGGGGSGPQQDRAVWLVLLEMLRKNDKLPCVAFTFSKKKCETNSDSLQNLDLTTPSEKSEIHIFIKNAVSRLRGTDCTLPQVLRASSMLQRGIGVHHGGLLPIIKETVEMLFQRGLVKVLFATETFAMGVNMPARTVIFDSIRKHDGKGFRNLLAGEYIQMAGRAGRRGLDATGTVIILCKGDELPDTAELHTMMLGQPTKLESQFRLTYNMMLQLLRVQQLRVEDMLARSFSEFGSRKDSVAEQQNLTLAERKLEQLANVDCLFCVDLEEYQHVCSQVLSLSRDVSTAMAQTQLGQKFLQGGRVVVVNNLNFRNSLGVILISSGQYADIPKGLKAKPAAGKQFCVLVLIDLDAPPNPLAMPVKSLSVPTGRSGHVIAHLDAGDIMSVTKTKLKIDAIDVLDKKDLATISEITLQLRKLAEQNKNGIDSAHPMKDLKMNDIDLVEKFSRKVALESRLQEFKCTQCPELISHYGQMHVRAQLQEQMQLLKHRLSDESLELLPEYEQRLRVLKELKFLDHDDTVQLKGRVACEINTCDDSSALIVTELIFENILAELEPAEIVGLLSSLVFQEKSDSEPILTERMEKGKASMIRIATRIAELQLKEKLNTPVDDFLRSTFKFGLVQVVYEWAQGMPFRQIMDLTDILEGSIVRCITRLDETCRDVRNAARVIGDPLLYQKMEEASAMIKRDIVFAASLYTQ